MTYYLDLFSPETYAAFSRSPRDVSGFRLRQEGVAAKMQVGDKLICYLTKLSRWIGVLEVVSPYFKDDTPLFLAEDDPFVVRFTVKPIAWLEPDKAIPIRDDVVWSTLSFTKEHEKTSAIWTGKVRSSLNQLSTRDGQFLERLITAQARGDTTYPLDEREQHAWIGAFLRDPARRDVLEKLHRSGAPERQMYHNPASCVAQPCAPLEAAMTTFTPLRLTRSATIRLDAGPATVFPLFTPLGERLWVPDWNPTIIYPASGDIELNAVFTTAHANGAPVVWTVVESAPEHYRVAYVRVAPDSHVARISVQCAEAAPGATHATVTYVFTGLTEQGNAYVAQHTEDHYLHWMQQWEAAINAYPQTA